MAGIFDDAFALVADGLKTVFVKIRGCRKSIKISCFCFVALFAVLFSLVASGATMAYKVNYGGKVIATIKSKQQFAAAVNIVTEKVNGASVEEAVNEPQYNPVIVLNNEIDSQDVVADAIIENTETIVYASALKVNGEMIACVEDQSLTGCLEAYRARFDLENAECLSEFVDDIAVESGYYLASDIDDLTAVKSVIDTLRVETVATVSTDTEVPFTSVTEKTDTQPIGYSAVTTQGQVGLTRTVEEIIFVNGVETSRQPVATLTVSEPVNQIVTVGTAKSVASAVEKAAAYSSGFIFPLPRGTWRVSAYYGDGRGHQGIDICAAKGTNIYAVAGGTVIFSGYDGSYGNCVVVDHGNGLKTRYAHASQLCVNKGDTVETGDVIALVGITGNASGNHLHFEVLVKDNQVDPAPYIGLD